MWLVYCENLGGEGRAWHFQCPASLFDLRMTKSHRKCSSTLHERQPDQVLKLCAQAQQDAGFGGLDRRVNCLHSTTVNDCRSHRAAIFRRRVNSIEDLTQGRTS